MNMEEILKAPKNGITVRMYRPGHGDCFLLALPRKEGDVPFYILIDCGFKPGSQDYISHGKKIGDMVTHIGQATNYRLDLVIITHEHQDHVNGFWKEHDPYFKDFHIEEVWLAWTEDPADDLANELRARHKDQLLKLAEARNRLALAIGETDATVSRLDRLISLEYGGEDDHFNLEAILAADKDPNKSSNKQAMKLIKDKACENQGVCYLSPGGAPIEIRGPAGFRAFVLGPPRDEDLLEDEDPVGEEGFPGYHPEFHDLSFGAALPLDLAERPTPFNKRYNIKFEDALKKEFFQKYYGEGSAGKNDADGKPVAINAPWRRIDNEWLYSAETLALMLNKGMNNTTLVLAFEMPKSRKVLLFTGDAQRGSWLSWKGQNWKDNGAEITVRDLLARTVLYKVGHHGSHNATLAGQVDDEVPNLSWMGRDGYKDGFTAMIPAVNKWATEKNDPPWYHPLPSIKAALEEKARGRVFQTDEDKPEKPKDMADADWEAFLNHSTFEDIYFDYKILDE
jgi:beta-lactamase superfamily II metal-dependent hydrolase